MSASRILIRPLFLGSLVFAFALPVAQAVTPVTRTLTPQTSVGWWSRWPSF